SPSNKRRPPPEADLLIGATLGPSPIGTEPRIVPRTADSGTRLTSEPASAADRRLFRQRLPSSGNFGQKDLVVQDAAAAASCSSRAGNAGTATISSLSRSI